MEMSTVSVRYIVNDVDAAIGFYCGHLGFRELMHPDPAFAMLTRGDLHLVLSAPAARAGGGGGGSPMPDGRKQEPGGWNRFMLEVTDLDGMVDALRRDGVRFRNDVAQATRSSYSSQPVQKHALAKARPRKPGPQHPLRGIPRRHSWPILLTPMA
jgi:catechol 2,3-dioxygenase-like lactoylglutathione lyase family enzyme